MLTLNKRDSEMKEPWTNTQAICEKKMLPQISQQIMIYYITKKFQINLILQVSQRQSLRKVFKVGFFHFMPKEPLLCTKIFFCYLQCFIILCTQYVLRGHSFSQYGPARRANNVFIFSFCRVLCKQFLC